MKNTFIDHNIEYTACPVCGKANFHGGICAICNFNESQDYNKYLTLGEIPDNLQLIDGRIASRLAKEQGVVELESVESRLEAISRKYVYLTFAQLTEKADSNDPFAAFCLAMRYLHGNEKTFPEHVFEGGYYFEKAAHSRNALLQYALYQEYASKDSELCNKERAMYWLNNSASPKNPDLIYELANQYYDGNLVEKDTAKALEYYRQAANLRSLKALQKLAKHYEKNGDYTTAYEYYSKLAVSEKTNNSEYQYKCAFCLSMYEEKDKNKDTNNQMISWLQQAVSQNHPLAMCMYANYLMIVEQNEAEALRLYNKAALQNCREAQYTLEKWNDNEKGTNRIYLENVKWYRKAAEQGDANAQNTGKPQSRERHLLSIILEIVMNMVKE